MLKQALFFQHLQVVTLEKNKMMEQIQLLDVVALLEDIPVEKLKKGQVGTIVEVFDTDNFEVEFADKQGQTIATISLNSAVLLKLIHESVYA